MNQYKKIILKPMPKPTYNSRRNPHKNFAENQLFKNLRKTHFLWKPTQPTWHTLISQSRIRSLHPHCWIWFSFYKEYDVLYDMIWYDIWYDIWHDMTWYNMIWYIIYDIWYIIHLFDRTESNIIFIWSGKVILGEAKRSRVPISPYLTK